ncbi:MAG: cupin domain-containing protein [Chloroflexi bacterium]|nr:cupin domain-containing protein [Chloroflexota bacterium]
MEKFVVDPQGFFRVLWTSRQSQVATMVLHPGQQSSGGLEAHDADQVTYCLEGEGTVTADRGEVVLRRGRLLALKVPACCRVGPAPKSWLKTGTVYL